VFFSLCYRVLRRVLQLAALRVRSTDFKELEIVVPRHELPILRRRSRRPRMTWTDRIFLAGCTPNPSAPWVTQQASHLTWTLTERPEPLFARRFVLHKRTERRSGSCALFAQSASTGC
jgi:hypothetical protein